MKNNKGLADKKYERKNLKANQENNKEKNSK